jgi:hypothetical protein
VKKVVPLSEMLDGRAAAPVDPRFLAAVAFWPDHHDGDLYLSQRHHRDRLLDLASQPWESLGRKARHEVRLYWSELGRIAEPKRQSRETQEYLAQIGRQGGQARSPAKIAAARTNGQKGGRPRSSP